MGRSGWWNQRARLVQSASAYGAAALITVTLHEVAHGLTAVLFGLQPTVLAVDLLHHVPSGVAHLKFHGALRHRNPGLLLAGDRLNALQSRGAACKRMRHDM